MEFNPEKIARKENDDAALTANVDIFYMRHGKPEGKYAHDDMPYDEFYKTLDRSNSLNIKLDGEGKDVIIKSLNDSGIEKQEVKLILASPYLRAQETAQIAQGFLKEKRNDDVKVHTTDLLEEIDFDPNIISEEEYNDLLPKIGFWGIMKKIEEKWMSQDIGRHENAIESYERAKKLLKYLKRIRKWTNHDKILLVSHGWFGRVIQHAAQNGTPEDFFKHTNFIKEAGMYGIKHDINNDEFLLLNLDQNE